MSTYRTNEVGYLAGLSSQASARHDIAKIRDWEHTYGVTIENIDNPGWMLTVQLAHTPLQDIPFDVRVANRSAADWIHCAVSDTQFRGSGGAKNLIEILSIFLDWAKQPRPGGT